MSKSWDERYTEVMEAKDFYDIKWEDPTGVTHSVACVESEKDAKWKQYTHRTLLCDMRNLRMIRRSDGMVLKTYWRDRT